MGARDRRQSRTKFDKTSAYLAFLMISLPEFALAVILKYAFAIRFQIFPQVFVANDPFPTRMWELTLPALALAIRWGRCTNVCCERT